MAYSIAISKKGPYLQRSVEKFSKGLEIYTEGFVLWLAAFGKPWHSPDTRSVAGMAFGFRLVLHILQMYYNGQSLRCC